ncbi:GMC family oxidoreductase [Acidisoma silvae]|uniref:GMC family oxidoreductase n=1 Tax=Acidisoma silvae TaxID=2802396 RepID=A0A964DYZ8_9PROT|nr:GMC family oxidoreductase [Acidisoma silvae]MCB8875925.1 GMC family oxidoreductase [Acidisoma silvae]
MAEYDADVIVVGSGVMGGLTAYTLALQGKSVILLEAGPRVPRWKTVERFRNLVDVTDYNAPYPDLDYAPRQGSVDYIQHTGPVKFGAGFLKLVGGTTWHWGGATWRFLPHDMKLKSTYGVGRDFPISYEELEPFYGHAEREIGVNGNSAYDESGRNGGKTFPPRSTPYPMEAQTFNYMNKTMQQTLDGASYWTIQEPNCRASRPYAERPTCVGNNNCMPICPIGAQYSGDRHVTRAEKLGAKVIPGAVVYKIDKGPGGKITAVHYLTPEGETHQLTAKAFVMAAHALETPKILLMSDVANSSDQVGRNLMDHLGFNLIMTSKDALWPGTGPVQQNAILNDRDGPQRSHYASLKHQVGNEAPNVPVARYLLGKGVLQPQLDEQIRHMSARWMNFNTNLEQLPDPVNRIKLSPKKDKLGLPKPDVYYSVGEYEARTQAKVINETYPAFQRLFGGTVLSIVSDWQPQDHQMGTCIMGDDARTSVVDKDCRSWDHSNLFIMGTQTLPASSSVNPTLTGAALTLRAAAILAKEV